MPMNENQNVKLFKYLEEYSQDQELGNVNYYWIGLSRPKGAQ